MIQRNEYYMALYYNTSFIYFFFILCKRILIFLQVFVFLDDG